MAGMLRKILRAAVAQPWDYVGEGAPPLQAFYDAGVKVAVGTDSLASAPDLNVFAELALMRTLAPRVPARQLLASATVLGARALGFDLSQCKRQLLTYGRVACRGVGDEQLDVVGGADRAERFDAVVSNEWVGVRYGDARQRTGGVGVDLREPQ